MPIGGGALLTSASRTSDLGNIFLRNSDSDSRIVALSSAPLTAPGENYGSVMLAVELTLEDTKSGKRRTVHAAVKMVPRNKLIQKLFIPEITFPKEIEMYRTVIPTFQRMQRKYGVKLVSDFVPKYFGSRIGLNSNKFDLNAILMLENLKKAGFVHVDRTLGCDFDTARLVLRQLANLHALGVAVKLKEREMFFNQILPIIKPIIPFYGFDLEKTQSQLMNIVREDPECEEYLERYWKTVGQSKYGTTEEGASREPWATIAHCDFWISNVMVKLEANKAIDCKIFDFQFVTYDSPGRDLAVFIFTSVQNAVIRDRFDELIDEYLSEDIFLILCLIISF